MVARRSIRVLSGVLGVGLGIGTVTAAWAGQHPAPTSTGATVIVTAATGAADLFPGTTQGDLALSVTNPHTYDVTLDRLRVGTVTSDDELSCPSDNVTVEPATRPDLPVPAVATRELTVVDVVRMAADAPDGCQGASFAIGVTVGGHRSAP